MVLWSSNMIPDSGTTRNFDCRSTESSQPEEVFGSEVPVALNLESVIDLTGETLHLNELVMLHIRKKGGVTNPATYFAIVHPVLDLLEAEIRSRYRTGMTPQELKQVIWEWIDNEIRQF